jgi:peroxiredoxin
VVGIDVAEQADPREKARAFSQRHQLTYPILVDPEGTAQRAFGVRELPTNVILGPEGIVRYHKAGFDPAAIDRVLDELIGKQGSEAPTGAR